MFKIIKQGIYKGFHIKNNFFINGFQKELKIIFFIKGFQKPSLLRIRIIGTCRGALGPP